MAPIANLCCVFSLALLIGCFPSVVLANHGEEGVINDTYPLTIGTPAFPANVYSGVSLTISPLAPQELRFKTGQAAWVGLTDAAVVDTELEQSAFMNDLALGLPLVPNPQPNFGDFGLVLGDLIPQDYYGPFPNGVGPSHLNPHISVTYRLIGSSDLLPGRIESFAFVPEPNATPLIVIGIGGLACIRRRSRRA